MRGARPDLQSRGCTMKKAITKRAVDALKPGEYITDTDVLGFVVRRLPSGRLSYAFRYAKDGKRRWIRLGVGIPPDAARKAALKHAGNVAGDGDPLPEREARRVEAMTARTVDDVLDGFLRHAKVKGLRTVEQMKSRCAAMSGRKSAAAGSTRSSAQKSPPCWTTSPPSPRNGRATRNLAVSPTWSWAWCARRSTGMQSGTMSSCLRSSRAWRERRSRS